LRLSEEGGGEMTIKDILDTPISEMWETLSPFVIGYLLIYGLIFVLALSFIVFVFISIIKGRKESKKIRKNFYKNKF
jgi:uncharacterized protein (DUF2062 family)